MQRSYYVVVLLTCCSLCAGQPLLPLLGRTSQTHEVQLSSSEKTAYNTLFSRMQRRFTALQHVKAGKGMGIAAQALLQPLQRACSIGGQAFDSMIKNDDARPSKYDLIASQMSRSAGGAAATGPRTVDVSELRGADGDEDEMECSICLEIIEIPTATPCKVNWIAPV